ncbi:MAG: CPBP family intramembrane glutamic endopeptidase [Terriglobales bacterium]
METPLATEAPAAQEKNPWIAPWWHLVLILALLFSNSFAGSSGGKNLITGPHARIVLYSATFIFELVIVLLIWLAIVRRGVTMRALIGGRWDTFENFVIDVLIAAAFWAVSTGILIGIRVALGTLDLHNTAHQAAETKKILAPLIPRTWAEASFFLALAVGAGLFEEIIFRGYLQRQFAALGQSVWAGIVLSAVVFGLGHGYQGNRMMIVIGVYGALFGILVYLRKSLRPGMMAHGFQDAFTGLALFFLTKNGMI